MIKVSHRKILGIAIATSIMLATLTGLPSLAQTPSTPPSTSPGMPTERPAGSMMSPEQMQQKMMMIMGEMHGLMGEMQQRISQMTPEQMQEFRPLMMEHHRNMIEQTQQLIDAMPPVEAPEVTESNGESDI